MIDNELDQLSRALIAATDRLNSQDFKDRQARLVAIEGEIETASIEHERMRQKILGEWNQTYNRLTGERDAVAAELEAEERAVEKAQAALQQHVAVTYLDADLGEPEPAAEEELFGTDPHFAIVDAESDEFSSPRANGAYTD